MKNTELEKRLPELSYVVVKDAAPGDRIGIIKRGESGYHRTDYDRGNRTDGDIALIVDKLNEGLGVTKQQAAAMYFGSLFSFAAPGADPSRYDETGRLQAPAKTKAA
jgi:hypothetical protein